MKKLYSPTTKKEMTTTPIIPTTDHGKHVHVKLISTKHGEVLGSCYYRKLIVFPGNCLHDTTR
jgi:hypothetical protein